MPALFWTPDKIDAVETMRNAGASIADIAAHFDRTPDAVRNICAQFGFRREVLDTLSTRARELWRQGKNTHEIARELGVKQAVIHNTRCYLEG